MTTATATRPAEERVERLNAVSAKRVIDPDQALTGTLGAGQVLGDELLSISELDVFPTLTKEQRIKLSRE